MNKADERRPGIDTQACAAVLGVSPAYQFDTEIRALAARMVGKTYGEVCLRWLVEKQAALEAIARTVS